VGNDVEPISVQMDPESFDVTDDPVHTAMRQLYEQQRNVSIQSPQVAEVAR
jgi:hypothetical protein